ncbi:MAG: hypothetical protein IPJ14_23620 [Kineosporiaceae bacterium]|nr:hypothetical protein [Kineosporiaceae bacterium]
MAARSAAHRGSREDWRRVLALACAMTVYPRGVGTVVDLPAAQEVEASAHEWDAQVPAFKQVLTVCGNLFGGKRSGKWLSDRLDKALAAFGEPADHRDKLVRLVPLVLRTGLIDDATIARPGPSDRRAAATLLT